MSAHAALALGLLAFGWQLALPAGTAEAAKLQGKIKKDVYTSPAKNFSVTVPKGLGLKVSDAYEAGEGIGAVSFHDDFGNQTGILYMRIPVEARPALESPEFRHDALEGFLEMVALPTWFHPASKEARIVHQEAMGSGDSLAFLGLISIPQGSVLVDAKTGKRLDSSRAALTRYEKGYVYVLLTEVSGGVFGATEKEPRSPEQQLAAGQKKLAEFLATIRFEAPPG